MRATFLMVLGSSRFTLRVPSTEFSGAKITSVLRPLLQAMWGVVSPRTGEMFCWLKRVDTPTEPHSNPPQICGFEGSVFDKDPNEPKPKRHKMKCLDPLGATVRAGSSLSLSNHGSGKDVVLRMNQRPKRPLPSGKIR